jgi:preprotein translocase subunit SecY
MFSKNSAWRFLWKSEDIRRKLLVTFLLLVLYRVAANVRVPGIDISVLGVLRDRFASTGNFLQFLDLLSGGTVSSFSLLSMGVYPYITAQIILQLLVPIIPSLQRRMEDNPTEGRKWMEKWTYLLTIPMAALSAIGQINIFNSLTISDSSIARPILDFGFTNTVDNPTRILTSMTALLTMMAGTMFAIWLGELISEYGIRNQGLSLIIFAGIVSRIPSNILRLLSDQTYGWILVTSMVLIMAVVVFVIVYVQQGRRNVLVMYPGRRVGNRMSMPVKAPLPLLVNMAGMIPLIFASAILQFPSIIASYFQHSQTDWVAGFATSVFNTFSGTGANNWGYWLMYFFMVVLFTFFYTDVLFTQQNYGENLKRVGAHIPGVTQGVATQRYLTRVQRRITAPGALFLGVVSILPFLVSLLLQALGVGSATSSAGLFLVSSAGLLIVVGVVRDTFTTIDAELKLHGYQDSLLVK